MQRDFRSIPALRALAPSIGKANARIRATNIDSLGEYAGTALSKLGNIFSGIFKRGSKLFYLSVAIPTLISTIYFGFIASDVYVSESRFVVRNAERRPIPSLGALLGGSGFSGAFSRNMDDTHAVHHFILSHDAVRQLDEKLDLRKMFTALGIDIFSRFAAWDNDTSLEALHLYYQDRVSVHLDEISGITTVTVRTFAAEDSLRINQMLRDMSEALVNRLNERGRNDLVRLAALEVAEAEQRARTAALELSNYRNQRGVVDPERQATVQLQQIARMQEELIATKVQLSQLQSFAPQNPQIPVLLNREQTLQSSIDQETAKVAGGQGSLANKAAEIQRLVLEREFADRQLASAMASLENARNEALRKQLYLEQIVQPNKPETPIEPRRLRAIIVTFVLSMIAWGILSILLAGVREHKG